MFGATLPDRFILQLTGEPAATHAVRLGRAEFRTQVESLQREHTSVRARLEARGVRVTGETTVVSNLIFVQLPGGSTASFEGIPGIVRVYPVRVFQHTLDHALPLHKVPDAWNQIGGASNAGTGIKVGMIDTGIDSQHPGMNDASMSPPDGFPKVNRAADAVFTNNKVIVARSYAFNSDGRATSALDSEGHGTGTSMIVAGASITGPNGPISGFAPKAFLGNYKVFSDDANGGASDDSILSALDDAVLDGMDVINLSLGSPLAPRPQDDVLVLAVEAAIQAGKIVTISAGNSGADPNTIGSPGTAPDAITAGSTWNDRDFTGSLQLDDGTTYAAYPGSGPAPASTVAGGVVDVTQFDPTGFACDTLPSGSLTGSIALILRGVCTFEIKINNAQQAGAAAVIVYTDAARPDPIGMQVGGALLPAALLSFADGTALKQQISAGMVQGTVDFSTHAVAVHPNRLSSFSSRGPSSDSGIKPDLVAVGQRVSTATLNSGFVMEDGTSFSAPMVAGAAALIEAARPGLSGGQYRSLLVNSATPVVLDSGTGLTLQQGGTGSLNVLNALNSNIAAAPVSLSFGTGPGTVDQTRSLVITNIGSAPDTLSIVPEPRGDGPVPQLSDTMIQLNPGQSQSITLRMNADALAAGEYQGYLQIQGTQNGIAAMVPYWYAVPSGNPTHMTVLNAPTNGAVNSRQSIFVRPTDENGLPSGGGLTVSLGAGIGSVVGVQSADSVYPGVNLVTVRLARGTNIFHVALAGASADVTIQSP